MAAAVTETVAAGGPERSMAAGVTAHPASTARPATAAPALTPKRITRRCSHHVARPVATGSGARIGFGPTELLIRGCPRHGQLRRRERGHHGTYGSASVDHVIIKIDAFQNGSWTTVGTAVEYYSTAE